MGVSWVRPQLGKGPPNSSVVTGPRPQGFLGTKRKCRVSKAENVKCMM